jgi:3-deoxy-D-manno-octulosonate 8-phosphate phosphatase (KDO 8-P phosphatase)
MKKVPRARLARVNLLLLDVDGVLTDGRVFWSSTGWTRFFDVKDGYGIRLALRNNLQIAFLSGADSDDVRERARRLGVKHAVLGSEDKIVGFKEILRETQCKPEHAAYIADELFDIPVLKEVGLAATVPHAPAQVKKVCSLVMKNEGGRGAVRELIDMILEAKGL